MRRIKNHLPFVALCLVILASAAAVAQRKFMMLRTGRPAVKVSLFAAVERDKGLVPVEKASTVKSGEILDWTILSVNEGSAPAHEYKAVGTVPPGTEFIAGSVSADGSATVSYSIDDGKSFSAQPTIEEKQPDGSMKKRAALPSTYTQIRYEWSDPLDRGVKLNASYKVRLK